MDTFGAPQYESCVFCEGFYMPNYGEPVCELCHTFVYNVRDALENDDVRRRRRVSQTAAATDDKNTSEDSGNDDEDEPERPAQSNEQDSFEFRRRLNHDESSHSPAHQPETNKRGAMHSEQSMIDARLATLSRVTAESLYYDKRLRSACAPDLSSAACSSNSNCSNSDGASALARDRESDRDRDVSAVGHLPNEVLAHIFAFVDDLTLFSVRSVCRRWRDVVDNEVLASDGSWEKFTRRRWPLFEPRYRVQSWRIAYAKLLASAPCRRCLAQIAAALRCTCSCCSAGACGVGSTPSASVVPPANASNTNSNDPTRQRSESAGSSGGARAATNRVRAPPPPDGDVEVAWAGPEAAAGRRAARLDWRASRLRTEIAALRNDPPDGIRAQPLAVECTCSCCVSKARAAAATAQDAGGSNVPSCNCGECEADSDSSCVGGSETCSQLVCAITGPAGSPYEGGLFYVHMRIASSYPMRPPAVRFLTRIFHPNVSRHGDVGLDIILSNWCAGLTVTKTLLSIQSLLTDAYTHVAMEPAIARIYDSDRREFDRIARLWTWKFAMHDYLPPLPADVC